MRQGLSFIALAALVGCAASPEPAPAVVAAATPADAASGVVVAKQICERQTIIGSYRTQLVCYTPGGPNDPNISRTTEDISRQIGLNQAAMGRNK